MRNVLVFLHSRAPCRGILPGRHRSGSGPPRSKSASPTTSPPAGLPSRRSGSEFTMEHSPRSPPGGRPRAALQAVAELGDTSELMTAFAGHGDQATVGACSLCPRGVGRVAAERGQSLGEPVPELRRDGRSLQ